MALATGGTAVGETRTRSSPISWALRRACAVGITSAVPSGNTARTSRTRIDSFTFSLRFCRRGGKFLPGYMQDQRRDHSALVYLDFRRLAMTVCVVPGLGLGGRDALRLDCRIHGFDRFRSPRLFAG